MNSNNVLTLSQSGVSQESAMQNAQYGQSQGSAGSLTSYANNQLGGLSGQCTTDNYYYYPYQWPYYQYPTTYVTYATPAEPTYEIKVEKVANGFIVHKNGQKFVVSKPEEIVKYLKDVNGK
jgi:hypothetical protein